MKKYLVKVTETTMKENKYHQKGEIQTWYIGKESYVYRELNLYAKENGWSRKHFAEKYITDDKDFHKRMNDDFWEIKYEIIEVEI